jgi:hypothetical protein
VAFEKKCPTPKSDNDPPNDFTGEVIVDIFAESGLNSTNAGTVCLLVMIIVFKLKHIKISLV